MSELTAASAGLASCHLCCRLAPLEAHRCPRCGSVLHLRTPRSLERALALLVTASLLYVPANLYPIMYTDQFGRTEASTIIGGVLLLLDMGSVPVALVIFLFSVIVPLGKLMALFYLVLAVRAGSGGSAKRLTRMYRITEIIGKWSMVDVFVVSILAALVHVGDLLVIRPGVAALSFAGVVILTMLAAETFDARLIWDGAEERSAGE